MPRDLADVLHYFLPDKTEAESGDARALGGRAADLRPPAALPLLCVPVGPRDVLRAALAWSVTVEIARIGGHAILLAPDLPEATPVWPFPGSGPHGGEFVRHPCRDLGELHREALDLAVARSMGAEGGGVVLVATPPDWLGCDDDPHGLAHWCLLFTSADARDLGVTLGLGDRIARSQNGSRIAVTVHSSSDSTHGLRAFGELQKASSPELTRALVNYGSLVDDVHIYRAIVAKCPIGTAHPESPAARALREIARDLLKDACQRAL